MMLKLPNHIITLHQSRFVTYALKTYVEEKPAIAIITLSHCMLYNNICTNGCPQAKRPGFKGICLAGKSSEILRYRHDVTDLETGCNIRKERNPYK